MGGLRCQPQRSVEREDTSVQFGLMYLFSEFGDVPQAQIFNEFLEEVVRGRSDAAGPRGPGQGRGGMTCKGHGG